MTLSLKADHKSLSAAALGVLITASLMSGGVSINSLASRLNTNRKTIQDSMQELKSLELMKSSTAHYGGRYVSQSEITDSGHVLVFEYLTGLKKAYWGYVAKS